MIDKFCNWLDKSIDFTNAHFLFLILTFFLIVSFMFETVDKYEYLEKFHNENICSECGQVIHK